jgi:hypothetical protein
MPWLGLDIGGANLKIADDAGFALTREFALWRAPGALARELRALLAQAPPHDHLVATMTGELADCFADKEQGVEFILRQLEVASDGRHTRVYTLDGRMLSLQAARRDLLLVASANWHALARFASRYVAPHRCGLLLDIGSTTTDLIPLLQDQPRTTARSDLERLLAGQLVYTGVARSPVCAVLQRATYRGRRCPLAQEVFATAKDAYLLLGLCAEDPGNCSTADGQPATKKHARQRLRRMFCADAGEFHHRDAVILAEAVYQAQRRRIVRALRQLSATGAFGESGSRDVAACPLDFPDVVIVSGSGEFLAQAAINDWFSDRPQSAQIVSLAELLGPVTSVAATAYALAILARDSSPSRAVHSGHDLDEQGSHGQNLDARNSDEP